MDVISNENSEVSYLQSVPDIVDSIPNLEYKSVTDRYFSRRYCVNVKNEEKNDHLLLFHSNRICLVTLAPSHPLFKSSSDFVVDYQIGNVDRSKNAVKGKGKKGGQLLDSSSILCKILLKDGTEYKVSSCINGKLIEVNEMLSVNPSLLRTHPDSDGYIAVILSNIATSDSRKDELLTEEQYLSTLSV